MKNMKVSARLILSFSIIIAFMAAVGVAAIIGMTTMDRESTDMHDHQTSPLPNISKIIETMQRMRVNTREYLIGAALDDMGQIESAYAKIQEYRLIMTENFDVYRATMTDEEAIRLFDEARSIYNTRFKECLDRMYDYAVNDADIPAMNAVLMEYLDDTNKIVDNLDQCMALNVRVAEEKSDLIGSTANTLLIVIVALLVVAVLVSMFLAFYISGLISKPLHALTGFMRKAGTEGDIALEQKDIEVISRYSSNKDEIGQCIASAASFVGRVTDVGKVLETVANGDLTAELALLSERDEMGHSLQKMTSGLNSMFGEIHSSTEQVSTGSKQIADGAQALAQGATEQAAAVEELSSSISEIANKTRANAEMARRASLLAEEIKSKAETGSSQMDAMIKAVREINEASQSIGKVISTIDNIAFQTNILALNAAVEAARAGQHGKGFAVVAEEVRNLATKSAAAARETGDMIQNSIEKAELGAGIAGETASSLAQIVAGINESSSIVKEIAVSSEEQAAGISQINTGIDQVAQVVQQNSATAEQSAAASEEMSGQAIMLKELISQFKLKDGGHDGRALPASVKPVKKLVMPEKPIHAEQNIGFGKY